MGGFWAEGVGDVEVANLGNEAVVEGSIGVQFVAVEEDGGVDFVGCEGGEEVVVEH